MADDLRILIQAEADEAASARNISSQLPAISKQIKERVKVGVEVDENSISSDINNISRQVNTAAKRGAGRVVIPVDIGIQADTLKRKLAIQADTLKKSIARIDAPLDWSKFDREFNRGTLESLRQASKELGILRDQYRNFDAGIAKILPRDAIENLNKYIGDTTSKTAELATKFQGLRAGVPDEAFTQFQKLYTLQKDIANIPTTDIEARSKKYNEISGIIDNLNRQYKLLFNSQKQADQGVAFDTTEKRAQKLLATVENLRIKYGAFLTDRNLVAQYNQLFDSAKTAKSAKEIANVNAQIGKFEQVLVSAGKNQRSFGAELSNNIKKLGTWMMLGGLMASAFRGFRDVVANVKQLNIEMISLRKVTDETDATYSRFLDNAKSRAIALGTSLTDLVSLTSSFAKLGYSIQDATKLAEVASVYQNVGEISNADEAMQSVVSTMKAFRIEASDSIKIIDLFNHTGNRFAVTAEGAGNAMQRAGAALAVGNNTLEQSVALWTAMNEVLQDDQSSATALRFIAQRMRNTAGQLQDMGEDADGAAESITKLQQQIRKITGVDIMADATTFRDTYGVLKDISEVWETITDKDRADVIRLMAGTRQASAFSSLMVNFSTAEKVIEESVKATGSAMEEHSRWMEGIEAKQKKALASFQAFSSAILDSDLVKGAYDTGSGILGLLTKATELLHAFPVLATTAMGALSIKLPNIFEKTSAGLGLSEATRNLFSKQQPYAMLGDAEVSDIFSKFAAATDKGAVALRDFNAQTKDTGIKAYLATVQNGVGDLAEYQRYVGSANQALAQMSLKSKLAAVGMKALSVATSMAITMGVSILIDLAVTGINNLIHAQDNAIAKAKETSSAWEDTAESLKSMRGAIDSNGKDFERLSKGVNALGENVSLTTDEYNRYHEIANSIAQQFPNMVSGWDGESNAILKTTTSMQSLNAEYEKAAQLANDRIRSSAGDVFSGFKAEVSKMYPELIGALDFKSFLQSSASTEDEKHFTRLKNRPFGYSISPILESLGLSDASVAEIRKNGDAVVSYINTLTADLNNSASQVKTVIFAELNSDAGYSALEENVKKVITAVVNGLDYTYLDQASSMNDLNNYISKNIVGAIANPEVSSAINEALSIQDAMKKNEASVQEFLSEYSKMQHVLMNSGVSAPVYTGVSSLFDDKTINTMVNHTKNILQDQFDEMVGSLTIEDLTIAYKLENVGNLSFEELVSLINKTKETDTLSLDVLSGRTSDLFKNQSTAAEVLKSLSDGAVLTSENFKKLEDAGYNLSDVVDSSSGAFRTTADAIDQANKAAAAKLQSDINLAKSNALTEYQKNALELVTQELALNKARESGIDINTEYFKQIEDENDTLKNRQKELEDSIQGYDRLTSEIQYATSAYKKWLDAQNAPESGDQYRGTVDAIKRMKELLKEGRVGTQEYQAASDYLVPKEIQDQGVKAVQKYTKTLDKYFKDGSAGALQFAKDLAKADLANYDPKTQQFELFSTSLSDIADKMGITEDAAYALFQMLNELTPDGKGFVFDNPNNKSTEQIDAANKAAQEYANSLVAVKDAQDALNKAQTESEKATAQSTLDNLITKSKELGQNMWSSIFGVGQGVPEQLSLQQQIDEINKTLGALSIEIPATVKFDAAAEIAKILSPFQLPENQPDPIVVQISENGSATVLGQLAVIDGAGKNISGTKESPSVYVVVGEDGSTRVIDQFSAISGAADDISGTIADPTAIVTVGVDGNETVMNSLSDVQSKGQEISNNPVIVTVKYIDDNAASQKVEEQIKHFIGRAENTLLSGTKDEIEGLFTEIVDAYYAFQDSLHGFDGELPFSEDTIDLLSQRWQELIDMMKNRGGVGGKPITIPVEPEIEEPDTTLPVEADISGADKTVNDFVTSASKKTISIQARVQTAGVTSFANGTRHAKDELAMVGDSTGDGSEIVNHRKRGFWEYFKKPTLVKLDKGDEVYNNQDTKRILGGKTSSVGGRSFPTGTSGNLISSISNIGNSIVSGITNFLGIGKSGNSKKSSNTAFLKTLESWVDWFPRILEAAQKTTEQFKRIVDNAIGYIRKNGALEKVVASVRDEIAKNEQAAAVYQAKADEIAAKTKLSADWVRKIQEGSPEVEVVSDKKLKEKIDAYQEWYNKAQDVRDAIVELREQENELAKQSLDNIISDYENRLNRTDARITSGQTNVDRKTALGKQVVAGDYLPMLNATNDRMSLLAEQRRVLNTEFEKLVASGVIQKDGDAWHQYIGEIESLDDALVQAEIQLQELKNAASAVDLTNLQYTMSGIEQLRQSRQNVIDLRTSQGGSETEYDLNAMIDATGKVIVNYQLQNELLQNMQSGLDPLSERYQELQSQINDNVNAIAQARNAQEEWNDAISDLDIKSYQDQIDALQKANDKRQKAIELQNAEQELTKAQQRRIRVLQNGQFVYTQDQKAIADAQNKRDDLRHQEQIDKLEEIKESIEKSKETNNIYDVNGNKLPSYDGGGVHRGTGLALLHNNESVLTPAMSENLLKLLSANNLSTIVAQNITDKMLSGHSLDNLKPQAQVENHYTFQFKDITLHEVNDTREFWSQLMRESESILPQVVNRK